VSVFREFMRDPLTLGAVAPSGPEPRRSSQLPVLRSSRPHGYSNDVRRTGSGTGSVGIGNSGATPYVFSYGCSVDAAGVASSGHLGQRCCDEDGAIGAARLDAALRPSIGVALLAVPTRVDLPTTLRIMEQPDAGLWSRWKRWDNKASAITWRFIGAVLIPLFAVTALVVGSMDLGPAVRAARGDGMPGTFLVTSRECGKSCTLYGDFTSDDGSVVRVDVMYLDGTPRVQVGDSLRALDAGDRSGVFRPSGSHQWALIVIVMGMGAVGATWWLWRYPLRALLRLRRQRGGPSRTVPTAI
jgi:hypothetical protein